MSCQLMSHQLSPLENNSENYRKIKFSKLVPQLLLQEKGIRSLVFLRSSGPSFIFQITFVSLKINVRNLCVLAGEAVRGT
jgi:hypothetical protein